MNTKKYLGPVYKNNISGLVRLVVIIFLTGIIWASYDLLLPFLFLLMSAIAYTADLEKYLASQDSQNCGSSEHAKTQIDNKE